MMFQCKMPAHSQPDKHLFLPKSSPAWTSNRFAPRRLGGDQFFSHTAALAYNAVMSDGSVVLRRVSESLLL